MSSEIKANKISPATGTAFTLGDSGDTFTIPSGTTLDIASGATIDATGATATGFGVSNVITAVHRTSSQSITKNVITKLQFNGEDVDPEGWFDSSTNYRFQPDESGTYLVLAEGRVTGTSSEDVVNLYLYKNGVEVYNSEGDIVSPGSNYPRITMSAYATLNGSSDYLEVYIRCGANGTLVANYSSFNGTSNKNCRAIFVRMT